MSSVITRGISVLHRDGPSELFNKGIEEIKSSVIPKLAAARGSYTLAAGETEIELSAPTAAVVKRNRNRLISEGAELRDFLSEIDPTDTVYDIGANTGLYTLFAAELCSEGEVVSFEPYPPNADLLEQDADRNQSNNISIHKIALSDSSGYTEFTQPSQKDVGYGSASIQPVAANKSMQVPTISGDELISAGDAPAPNIVKIDVEGAESLVIEGLKSALSAQDCRAVYCEVHLPGVDHRPSVDSFDSSLEEIIAELECCGFDVDVVGSRGEYEVFLKGSK